MGSMVSIRCKRCTTQKFALEKRTQMERSGTHLFSVTTTLFQQTEFIMMHKLQQGKLEQGEKSEGEMKNQARKENQK